MVLLEARREGMRLITPTRAAQAALLLFAIAALVVPFAAGVALFIVLGTEDPLLFVGLTAAIGLGLALGLLALRPWTPEFLARHPRRSQGLRVLEVWHGTRPGTQELHVEGDGTDFWIVVPGTRARVADAVSLAGQAPVYVEGRPPRPR